MCVAWLVVGMPHYRAVFIDQSRAIEEAAKHHGVIEPLIRESDAAAMLQAAFEAGLLSKDKPCDSP